MEGREGMEGMEDRRAGRGGGGESDPRPLLPFRSLPPLPPFPLGGELPGILLPLLLVVVAAVLALRLLNGLPAYVAHLTTPPTPAPPALAERLEYATLAEAEADLQVEVATPVYLPAQLVWPPASIRGQREHARVVSLLIRDTDGQQALQIREIFWPGEELPFAVPEPMEVVQRTQVEVNGAKGELLLGRGQGGAPVHQLRWHAGGVHAVVTTILPPEELLRISRSMHLEETGS